MTCTSAPESVLLSRFQCPDDREAATFNQSNPRAACLFDAADLNPLIEIYLRDCDMAGAHQLAGYKFCLSYLIRWWKRSRPRGQERRRQLGWRCPALGCGAIGPARRIPVVQQLEMILTCARSFAGRAIRHN